MVWFPERSHSLYFLSTGIGYRLVVSSSWIHSDRIQSKQRCVAFVFHDAELEAALLLIHSVITRRLIPYTSHSRQQWPMSPEPQWCEPVTFLFNCTSAETILVPSFSQLLSPLFHFSLSLSLSLLPLPKAFLSFLVFQTLKTKVCYSSFSFSSPFAKKNSPRTNRLNSFCVSLLPFPKERRNNHLNSFVSPISLVKEFKMTQSDNSFDSSHSLIQKRSKV